MSQNFCGCMLQRGERFCKLKYDSFNSKLYTKVYYKYKAKHKVNLTNPFIPRLGMWPYELLILKLQHW